MRASFIVTLAATLCATAAVAVPIERRGGDGGRATFYYGHDLLDPACGGDAPTDDDLVAAVRADSPFKCGDKVGLWYKGKSIEVTIRDHCEGCTYGGWFDLTKCAFSKLADLDVGILEDVKFWHA